MHSFFVPPGVSPGDTVSLSAEESAHAARVLRLRPGEKARLIEGEGRAFSGELVAVSAEDTRALVGAVEPARECRARLTVYQGLPKAEKLEWIVQKLTELGAARVVPVEMRFSVARAQKGGAKDARLTRIAREAVKQCGRAACPDISAPVSFAEALADMKMRSLMLMPWEKADDASLKEALLARPGETDIGLLIGPEGGIAPEEARAVLEAGGIAVTLGERILRTETAAIAAAAIALALSQ